MKSKKKKHKKQPCLIPFEHDICGYNPMPAELSDNFSLQIDRFEFQVQRKDVKHLRISLTPSSGKIRISAPLWMDDERIYRFAASKLDWIEKHLAGYEVIKEQCELEYISGEIHYLEGKPYQLNVIQNAEAWKIQLRDDAIIDLYEPAGKSACHRKLLLDGFYRIRLTATLRPLIIKWQDVLGVQVSKWKIKKMKSRWGSCNPKRASVSFNLELGKRPLECVEHVVVHELMHFLEPSHNARFKSLMGRFLPDWRDRDKLLKSPLGKA